jgi:class 3 adenylate cyclase/tetratricopeptide (TPR) repeat protein
VTILFSDLTDFTGLAERLDPELLRSVMSRYFEEMRRVVQLHGGTVEKFIGDAVMAVFGVPVVREDDAFRAVRAAMDMRDALTDLNQDLESQWGVKLALRIGINTGEVATEDSSMASVLVIGDAVNIAARLQQIAAPHEILLGPDTHALVSHRVRVAPVKPLTLKGKSTAIPGYRLIGLQAVADRRSVSPMVGRDTEFERLRAALERVVAHDSCELITILASAGVGKSRLAAEFLTWARTRATTLQGHCLAYGEAVTFWPVEGMIRQAAELSDECSPDDARTRIILLLGDDRDGTTVAERCLRVLRLGGQSATNEEIFWAVRKVIEAVARSQPAVVVFEDTHWAEPALLDLIEHIADWAQGVPLLLLCLARPTLLEARPTWAGERSNSSLIELQPLSGAESTAVVENLLGGGVLPERARQYITYTAEGNPLYLEELLSMLLVERLLVPESGRWTLTRDLHDVTIPLGIQALLTARLERLATEERVALEFASVLGTECPPDGLSHVVPSDLGAGLVSILGSLVDKGFMRMQPAAAGEESYRFHHVLLRDAAYHGMSMEARAKAHRRAAHWLETAERIGEHDELIGYHLEKAYRSLEKLGRLDDAAGKLAGKGAERLAAAGRSAFARGDMLAACNLLSRSVSLPGNEALRLWLLPDLSEALMSTGELERADAVITQALEAAGTSGDERLRAHAQLVRAAQRVFTRPEARMADALRDVEATIAVFEQLGDELGLARGWRFLAIIHFTLARFRAATDAMDVAAAHAHNAGERRLELEALAWLPLFVWAGPAPPEPGVSRCQEIVERADGDRQVEASALLAIAGFEAMRGRFDVARTSLERARRLLEDLGLRVWIGGPWSQFSGLTELLAGDYEAAEEHLRLGYETLLRVGESGWLSTVVALLAQTLYAQGRDDEADHFAGLGEEAADAEDVYSQIAYRCVRAKIRARSGRLAEAEGLAREAVQFSEGADFPHIHATSLADLGEVLELAGRPAEAISALRSALRLFEGKGNTVTAGRVQADIDRLVCSLTGPVQQRRI